MNIQKTVIMATIIISITSCLCPMNFPIENEELAKLALTTDHVWREMIEFGNTSKISIKGNQILHFSTRNRNPSAQDTSGSTKKYIDTHFKKCTVYTSDADILAFAVKKALPNPGSFMEFGVGMGKTTNFIAALAPHRVIHGFDSFEGLPEDWTKNLPKGTFKLKDAHRLPALFSNVVVHKGLFNDILPSFKKVWLKDEPIAFINIDSDLYSSAKSIFDHLAERISSGTIIHFDEYYGYNGWLDGEFKAFQEFVKKYNISYRYLAYNARHQQVVVEII